MRNKIILKDGEKLKLISNKSKGHMGQTEITTYSVVDEGGNIVGSVVHTDAFQINGLRHRNHVIQKDSSGNVLVDLNW